MRVEIRTPRRVMIDTGVFLRWVGDQQDADTDACYLVVEHVLSSGGTVLFAAPCVAEVLRYGLASSVPRKARFEVVGFDELAARKLAEKLPLSAQRAVAVSSPNSLTHIKYDAMIVACAIRHKALLHIALDDDHHKLCKQAEFAVARPKDLIFEIDDAPAAQPPTPPESSASTSARPRTAEQLDLLAPLAGEAVPSNPTDATTQDQASADLDEDLRSPPPIQ